MGETELQARAFARESEKAVLVIENPLMPSKAGEDERKWYFVQKDGFSFKWDH